MNIIRMVSVLSVLALLTGCVNREPYDYTSLIESKPRSILVLPPVNNTVEVEAPYIYLSTITQPLAERGYYVFPVTLIDNLMKQNGLPTPEDMHSVALNKIDEIIGADSVLYVTIDEWGQKYQVTASVSTVDVKMKLVDVKTGVVLWEGNSRAQKSSGDGGGGLLGAMIGAIVTQMMSEVVDHTPTLARQVNRDALYNATNGLLTGPYVKKTKDL